MTNRIMVAAVFLVGCAVGGVSSQLVVPKASAQQATTLTKWEYMCVEANSSEDIQHAAVAAGAQGWEMAVGTGAAVKVWCFKRPKM
jgi:hypothetical protein